MGKQKVLIVIPAFNEEKSIDSVIQGIKLISEKSDYTMEYLVVDDCSKDHTLTILREKNRNYISLAVNLGIGGGMQCGYLYAMEHNYDIAVQMDADGQHEPKYLDQVIRPVLEGQADMAIGSRFLTGEGFQSSAARRVGIWFLSRLIKYVCKADIKDVTSGFRAVGREVICLFTQDYAQDYPEPESIVSCVKNKFRICEVPVVMHERVAGQSSISTARSLYYMCKVSLGILIEGVYGGNRK